MPSHRSNQSNMSFEDKMVVSFCCLVIGVLFINGAVQNENYMKVFKFRWTSLLVPKNISSHPSATPWIAKEYENSKWQCNLLGNSTLRTGEVSKDITLEKSDLETCNASSGGSVLHTPSSCMDSPLRIQTVIGKEGAVLDSDFEVIAATNIFQNFVLALTAGLTFCKYAFGTEIE